MVRRNRFVACVSFAFALSTVACGGSLGDRDLAVKVGQEISNSPVLADAQIDVAAQDGVVILAGVVSSEEQMKSAERLAWSVQGVEGVESRLRVAAPEGDAQ